MNISGIKLYSPDCFDIGIIYETSGWRILWKKVIAVIGTTFAFAKRKPEKIYNEPIQRPTPSWLVSSIVRALHRYHRGVKGWNPLQACIFSGFLFATAKSCVYNCDDILLYNSSPRSSHIWFSYIHNFIIILPAGLLAQLVERCTGIVEVKGCGISEQIGHFAWGEFVFHAWSTVVKGN